MGVVAIKLESPSRIGLPDLLLMYGDRYALVEVKQPRGRLSPVQKAVLEEFTGKGIPCYVCRDIEYAEEIIDSLTGRESGTGG
jgi:hypothetical protein